jgi:RNA polymerase sigma factor (sigma-70 family)
VSKSKYKTYTDPQLVAMCLNGDALAWEALISRYRRMIFSVPVKFGLSTNDASDVFQLVCLKLVEHLHNLKDESRVSGWLVTTAIRQCIHLRTLKGRETEPEVDFDETIDPVENLEELRLIVEERQSVRESVDQLPQKCKSLIELLYFDEQNRSYDEIAESLGMPVSSIGPIRARCLERLRAILRKKGIKK